MSRQSSYIHHQPPDNSKASYDDLIDQYASPYAVTSKHKSFTFDPSSVRNAFVPPHPQTQSLTTQTETVFFDR